MSLKYRRYLVGCASAGSALNFCTSESLVAKVDD